MAASATIVLFSTPPVKRTGYSPSPSAADFGSRHEQSKFWTIASLANFGARAASFGIIALGVVFLLSMGEIDLSTGSIYGLTINAAAVLMVKESLNPWIRALQDSYRCRTRWTERLLCAALRLPVIIVTLVPSRCIVDWR